MKNEKNFTEQKEYEINQTSEIDKRKSAGEQMAHYSELRRKDEEEETDRKIQDRIRLALIENEEKTGGNLHLKYLLTIEMLNIDRTIKKIDDILFMSLHDQRAELVKWRKELETSKYTVDNSIHNIANFKYYKVNNG